MANLGIPSNTLKVLEKYNFSFQKKFGQNFLIDTHILEGIIKGAGITEDDCVLEIGPGVGCLTQELSKRAGKVLCVELDKALKPILADQLARWDHTEADYASAMKALIDYAKSRPRRLLQFLKYCEYLNLSQSQMEHYFGATMEMLGVTYDQIKKP